MKNTLLLSFIFFSTSLHAQYYYKDIFSTREANDLIKTYRINNVQVVNIKSFEADGFASEGFFGQQVMMPGNHLKTVTRSGITGESVLTSTFDDKDRVILTVDSTGGMVSTTTYLYRADGKLESIKSTSTDTGQSINETEQRNWYYNTAGKPDHMQRIINKGEPIEIKFVEDENGNIGEEQTFKKGTAVDLVYYYYDDKNRLTDVVRYNSKVKRLLPDYMFEYSDANQVIQKITVPARGSDYLIWRYQYDSKGLKTREAIFNKDKKLTGKIEYSYQFGH